MGQFAFPLTPVRRGTELNQPVTPAWLISSSATSKAPHCKSRHDSQMLPRHFHHPPAAFERGKGGTHTQSLSCTRKAERKVKCNAFSGIPTACGRSKLPPPASLNMVQISFQTAQLQARWLNIKSRLHFWNSPCFSTSRSRLALISMQRFPFWYKMSQKQPHVCVPTLKCTLCHQTSRWATPQSIKSCSVSQACFFLSSIKDTHTREDLGSVSSPHPQNQTLPSN